MKDNSKVKVYGANYREFPNDTEKGFINLDKNNIKNLVEIRNSIIKEKIEDLIYIQKITKNIVTEIFNIFPIQKLNICAKLLNFPEKIYVDETNKDNPKIYFENYNYISMNYSGTIKYFDSIKRMGSEINKSNPLRNEILGQEIAFNLGKLVYCLLNGVEYSTTSQMYKKNNPTIFQNFFDLTLRHFATIKSPNDIKLIEFISLDDEQIKKILSKDIINYSSDMSSYINGQTLNIPYENKEIFKGKDIMFQFYFGKGYIENCFSIIPRKRKRTYQNNFEINEKTMNEIMGQLNNKVNEISLNYLEKHNIFNNNIE